MDKHPIENIMTTTMENIRDMVDVNTVIGDPVPTPDGATIIPLTRVCFGFAAGGGEYACAEKNVQPANDMPFAGGSGAGVTVQPVGFLVVDKEHTRVLPAQYQAPIDHVLEAIPHWITEIKNAIQGSCASSNKPQPPQPTKPPQPTPPAN